jgi:hypothetical protein
MIGQVVPIVVPMNTNGGGGEISLLAIIVIVLIVWYVIQIIGVFFKLFGITFDDEYKSKTEFLMALIPFVPHIIIIVNKIKEIGK